MAVFSENTIKPKILIVDDQEALRILLTECLNDLDIEIDEAESGEIALKKLSEDNYSLIILDIQMPRMDGFEVMEHVRNDLKLDDIPVVFVSAVFDQETYIIKGIEKGAIDFVSKPINHQIFRRKVINFLKLYEKQAKLDQLVKTLERTNKQLKENETKFRRITQSANDSIILLDSAFNIRFWNRASKEIFGYVKYEIISENFLEKLIPQRSRVLLISKFDIMNESSQSALSTSFRLTAINKIGIEFPVELSLGRFETSDHEIRYTVVIRDISHRVKMEKEMLKAKELKESNKIMKEFMDNVSHELRTPMNAILGISNMLLKYNADNLNPKQLEGLKIINQSGTRLLDLINDVLDVSRIESGKLTVDLEKLDLEKYMASLRSIVDSLIGEKKIRFFTRKSASVQPFVMVDQEKLNQILMNLLGNAVKFTEEGSIHLFIHAIDNKLYFEVADTGIGMEPENVNIIFDRFRQIDNSSSKEYKGTGLGLHICKRLIELLNGEIKVESSPGKGTTMKFYITTGENPEDENPTEISSDTATNESQNLENPDAPLAMVIDEGKNVFLYKKICVKKGFNVVVTEDAAQVQKMLEQYIPDLIILKYEMPKIRGRIILNWIRENKYLSDTHVFVISELEEVKLYDDQKGMVMLHEPLNESTLMENLSELPNFMIRQHDSDMVVFYEQEDRLKNIDNGNEEHFFVPTVQAAILTVTRRKIKNLVLDGLLVDGVNIKLLKWLFENQIYLPERIYVVTPAEIFKFQLEELGKLPSVKHLTLQDINGKTSLMEALKTKNN